MMLLVPWLALALSASPTAAPASLRVALRPLVGSADVRAIDEVIERELAETPGVVLIPSDQVDRAFASCGGQLKCFEAAAQGVHADEVVLGLAGLDRDSWLVELSTVDSKGAVLRTVSARWRADASQLKTLAGDLLNRLFAPDRNLAWVEVQPEGGSLSGLTLSLDGVELQNLRPGQPQLLTEGAHRLSILGSQREIELLFRAAPRDRVQVWTSIDQGTAHLVPSQSSLPLGVAASAGVAPGSAASHARRTWGWAALGGSALLAGGAAWAGGSWSWNSSKLSALTSSRAVTTEALPAYQVYTQKAGLNEGLTLGLGAAAVLVGGLGVWLMVGG